MTDPIEAVRTALAQPLLSEGKCREVVVAVLRSVREPAPRLRFGDQDAHDMNWTAAIDALIEEVALKAPLTR